MCEHRGADSCSALLPASIRPLQLPPRAVPSGHLRSKTGGEVQVSTHTPPSPAAGHPQQGHWDFCKLVGSGGVRGGRGTGGNALVFRQQRADAHTRPHVHDTTSEHPTRSTGRRSKVKHTDSCKYFLCLCPV